MSDIFRCGHDKAMHGKTNAQGNQFCALCHREINRQWMADSRAGVTPWIKKALG